ncbi:hypothetical protein ACFVU2_21165 [Leifsonia sp. NPDC058194]|uniref:hypothetical protein n=1 Tax=Leifsonia sp. NPDC058194 TaxID=3346374 RepID=UPI0036D93152
MSDDYMRLIEAVRGPYKPDVTLGELADAVEALVKNPQAAFDAYCARQDIHTYRELIALIEDVDKELATAEAERDALRAQLDSMRTEERTAWSGDYLSDDDFRQVTLQRLVGPWTPVEGEQA